MRKYPNRTDANQSEIVAAARKLGAVWIPCTGDPSIGFDGLVAWAGRVYVIEIKDGNKPPSSRRLTEKEQARKLELKSVGVPYIVVESTDDLIKLLNGK